MKAKAFSPSPPPTVILVFLSSVNYLYLKGVEIAANHGCHPIGQQEATCANYH